MQSRKGEKKQKEEWGANPLLLHDMKLIDIYCKQWNKKLKLKMIHKLKTMRIREKRSKLTLNIWEEDEGEFEGDVSNA